MKAITVKYIPATDTKPTRLKAFDADGNQITVSRHKWPDLDGEELSKKAAIELCIKMKWDGDLVGGWIKSGHVFCFKR